MPLLSTLKPIVIVDTREKKPFNLKGFETVLRALKTGDYSIVGFEDKFCIERKSYNDFYSTLVSNFRHFQKELNRMSKMQYSYIIVEGTLKQCLNAGNLRGKPPKGWGNTVFNNMIQLLLLYPTIQILFCSTTEMACDVANELISNFYFQHYKELS